MHMFATIGKERWGGGGGGLDLPLISINYSQ